ncbi:hypothetical protein PPL_10726 [Heterostelium album PN500]|uniref:Uncharacterized protein n=1 Tax=Heterostelium pallidum (strain ATCC 26659 / Pp 5 / PN500) TaxID=670386 RepID=D3BRW3_HETP5|nr:hypothetical protein PPL_10726 [Heterostelium album PN500]EFA76145.1 hypothetical protein PPL_10726 [Heterostelium album PN500]|eukprot:XP_020428279.1 hypothetical protein PPL_10726 [Heterostelium album PN500]
MEDVIIHMDIDDKYDRTNLGEVVVPSEDFKKLKEEIVILRNQNIQLNLILNTNTNMFNCKVQERDLSIKHQNNVINFMRKFYAHQASFKFDEYIPQAISDPKENQPSFIDPNLVSLALALNQKIAKYESLTAGFLEKDNILKEISDYIKSKNANTTTTHNDNDNNYNDNINYNNNCNSHSNNHNNNHNINHNNNNNNSYNNNGKQIVNYNLNNNIESHNGAQQQSTSNSMLAFRGSRKSHKIDIYLVKASNDDRNIISKFFYDNLHHSYNITFKNESQYNESISDTNKINPSIICYVLATGSSRITYEEYNDKLDHFKNKPNSILLLTLIRFGTNAGVPTLEIKDIDYIVINTTIVPGGNQKVVNSNNQLTKDAVTKIEMCIKSLYDKPKPYLNIIQILIFYIILNFSNLCKMEVDNNYSRTDSGDIIIPFEEFQKLRNSKVLLDKSNKYMKENEILINQIKQLNLILNTNMNMFNCSKCKHFAEFHKNEHNFSGLTKESTKKWMEKFPNIFKNKEVPFCTDETHQNLHKQLEEQRDLSIRYQTNYIKIQDDIKKLFYNYIDNFKFDEHIPLAISDPKENQPSYVHPNLVSLTLDLNQKIAKYESLTAGFLEKDNILKEISDYIRSINANRTTIYK